MKEFKKFILAVFIIILILLVFIESYILKNFFGVLFRPHDGRGNIELAIEEGMSIDKIVNILEEKKVIKNAWLFKYYVKYTKKSTEIKSGKYIFDINSSYAVVLDKLIQGPPQPETFTLVIPEGFTLEQIANRVEEISLISKRNFICEAIPEEFNYNFLEDAESLEGFLFPKTYTFLKETSAHNLIDTLLKQFETETKDLDFSLAKQNGINIKDIITIASLIEREVYIAEERELVSAVIYNRLEIDMPLAIDATLRYALSKWDDELTISDLNTDSPYNTRIYKGLPPTAICNPGIKSIKAALEPADVDYLYFVVDDPDSHSHFFTNSETEFFNFLNSLER
ncbi:MAG: endolytic transglycosylase MltG [Actinobacteria bacterium]|nr:endolytic transglycosylase MltG [Actinomycetota bacterium]